MTDRSCHLKRLTNTTTMVNDVNFVSIPRCASNSIHHALHTNNVDNHFSIRKTKDERWSFAVIRDPLERLISWWKYHQSDIYIPFGGEIYQRPFKDWARSGCPHHWTVDDLKNCQITNPLRQFDFVCDTDGNIMVDKLINFDDLGTHGGVDLEPVGGFVPLNHLNASHIGKTASLSASVIDYIHKQFESDYKIYNSL